MGFLMKLFGFKPKDSSIEFSSEFKQIDDDLLTFEDLHESLIDEDRSYTVHPMNPKTIKDVWLPLHGGRVIMLTGRLSKDSSIEGQDWLILDDGTSTIPINCTGLEIPNIDNRSSIHKVIGLCDSRDVIYPYLTSISAILPVGSPQASVTSTPSQPHEITQPKYASHGHTIKTRTATGANWTKNFSGLGVDSESNWQKIRSKIFDRDGYSCVSCSSAENLTVDHIQPLSLGGTNEARNLQTLCAGCHEDKHGRKFLDNRFVSNGNYGEKHRLSDKVQIILQAIDSQARLHIDYISDDGIRTRRYIRPLKLHNGIQYQGKLVARNAVFVDAFCELRRDKRTFRLSRVKSLSLH